MKIKQEKPKGKRTITKNKVRLAGLVVPVMIAMLPLAGSPSVKANDQPSAANAEVKIEHRRRVQVQGAGYGRKVLYTFTKAGTYPYFCSVHPKMTGKIVVQ